MTELYNFHLVVKRQQRRRCKVVQQCYCCYSSKEMYVKCWHQTQIAEKCLFLKSGLTCCSMAVTLAWVNPCSSVSMLLKILTFWVSPQFHRDELQHKIWIRLSPALIILKLSPNITALPLVSQGGQAKSSTSPKGIRQLQGYSVNARTDPLLLASIPVATVILWGASQNIPMSVEISVEWNKMNFSVERPLSSSVVWGIWSQGITQHFPFFLAGSEIPCSK